jgi:hypothetical protein
LQNGYAVNFQEGEQAPARLKSGNFAFVTARIHKQTCPDGRFFYSYQELTMLTFNPFDSKKKQSKKPPSRSG